MNPLGISAPKETSPENPSVEEVRARKPYVAPAIVEFGSVSEFTRGAGSAVQTDSRRTTRVRTRG